MAPDPRRARRFALAGVDVDLGEDRTTVVCRYDLDGTAFAERFVLHVRPSADLDPGAVDDAARVLHQLTGVSYFKAGAPPVLDLGPAGATPAERALVHAHHTDGLGEMAAVNDIDVWDLDVVGPERTPSPSPPSGVVGGGRPLVLFGGGKDSLTTVEGIRDHAPEASTFVVSKGGDRFDALEAALAATGLPVVRAERTLDPRILRSAELGYLNGHVPVTGILSALAVLAAAIGGHDAVVLSNEWSASQPTTEHLGRPVNHQWSKSLAFEDLFRAALAEGRTGVEHYSWLRPWAELWVARRFAGLGYLDVFRSCNRAFHVDPAKRLDRWCGECDKCCFVDLVLSPFVDASALAAVFDGAEPLRQERLADRFRALLGTSGDPKPFECVGDVDECRIAAAVAARRPDRRGDALLASLAAEAAATGLDDPDDALARMLVPLGPHRIPDRHVPDELRG